ncbi:hypothetical protein GQ54DRAFT_162903 [Martensiomyces pterosporus]|nr:hypothetical protein GQ54DRAFT_162903 [Martensiomyces pterosporus]
MAAIVHKRFSCCKHKRVRLAHAKGTKRKSDVGRKLMYVEKWRWCICVHKPSAFRTTKECSGLCMSSTPPLRAESTKTKQRKQTSQEGQQAHRPTKERR